MENNAVISIRTNQELDGEQETIAHRYSRQICYQKQ